MGLGLPIPNPSPLDMIENPLVRAYVDYKIHDCVNTLVPLKPVIQKIAEELHKREELTGAEVFEPPPIISKFEIIQ